MIRVQLVILTDASPWGLGGLLVQQGRIMRWFASEITSVDAEILQLVIGDSSAQQSAEALAALVAISDHERL
eukprot:3749746-Amphidinium_carterae.1